MENVSNDASTTLNNAGTLLAGAASMIVTSSAGFPAVNFRVRIDSELILVTAVAGTTWTITRGIEGTTAANHIDGSVVAHVISKGGLDQYTKDYGGIFKSSVSAGVTRVVDAGYNQVVAGPFQVDGDLQLDGDMVIL